MMLPPFLNTRVYPAVRGTGLIVGLAIMLGRENNLFWNFFKKCGNLFSQALFHFGGYQQI